MSKSIILTWMVKRIAPIPAIPYLDGPVASMVGSISGLDNLQYTHPVTKVSGTPEQQTTDSFQPAAMAQAASRL